MSKVLIHKTKNKFVRMQISSTIKNGNGGNMKDKLLQIINHYGIEKQLKYIHSEYFELDEAIINTRDDEYICYPEVEKSHLKHITEEIADVMVMLKQFQYYFDIKDEEIDQVMNYKIDRQLERIENENN